MSNIFPLKEFDTWEETATKTYPALKMFFHEAYGWRLTAIELRNTTGQNGYTNNTIYNAFENGEEDINDDTVDTIVTVPQAAATATMAGSLLGTTPGSTVNAEIAAAISQLSANQTAIMSQMAAMSFAPATAQDTCRTQHMFQVPPFNNWQSRCSNLFSRVRLMEDVAVAAAADVDAEAKDVCRLLTPCA
jgi:hypothetical protein